ncbi:hypothetical protein C8T65DRAFT_745643 [Cerioporus squamosus]|nr:hypothetical protein C8T65DRAFT_745643 [Cerioporus squamosus]
MLKRFANTLEELSDEGPLAVLPCVRAFPSLTHLSIVGLRHMDSLRPFVLKRTGPGHAGDDIWTNLMELQGSVKDLFDLSEHTSHIPRLVLHQTDRTGTQWSLPRDVLERARPVHLTYRTWGAPFLDEVKALCVIDEGKSALTHSKLDLGIREPTT